MAFEAEIDAIESAAIKLSADFCKKATFGTDTEEEFFNLLLIESMLGTIKRNVPHTHRVRRRKTTVELSSLRRQNNSLILDQSDAFECVDVEVSCCLSDQEVCTMLDRLQAICNAPSC